LQPAFEVADVLKAHWPALEKHPGINSWQLRTLSAVKKCRTADLGGHIDACASCGITRVSYNSCRNRHCPKCQGNKREEWIAARESELLPVPYFHVVFTLPDLLNPLAVHKPKELYDTLFEASWQTLKTFGLDNKHLGAQTGMIAILHTWGQTLTLHPHLHCIVPGGGLTERGKWKTAKSDGKYLFPVEAMSKAFRGKFIASLKAKNLTADKQLINALYKKEWVIYAKQPFGNPASVIEYLGRYTHKIAISNHRIKGIRPDLVTFSYKDYRHGDVKKEMSLKPVEFIRRFSLHILPRGFVRIRHFGILSASSKKRTLPIILSQFDQQLSVKKESPRAQQYNPLVCPCCNTQTMVTIEILPKRGPPGHADLMRKATRN
jgi:hypothetical protein